MSHDENEESERDTPDSEDEEEEKEEEEEEEINNGKINTKQRKRRRSNSFSGPRTMRKRGAESATSSKKQKKTKTVAAAPAPPKVKSELQKQYEKLGVKANHMKRKAERAGIHLASNATRYLAWKYAGPRLEQRILSATTFTRAAGRTIMQERDVRNALQSMAQRSMAETTAWPAC
jgi:hypothetical protein